MTSAPDMTAINVVRCKPDVTFDRIAPGGFRLLAAIDQLPKILGRDVWITAGTNDHETGRHPLGEAYDLSVTDWPAFVILRAVAFLRQVLGERFTVLYEVPSAPRDPQLALIAYVNGDATGPHLHLQVRKGQDYPPIPNRVSV